MFDNFDTIDPAEAEAKMRSKAPGALPEDERIIMAFKLRNHKLMFTPYRILMKDSSVIDTSAHEYTSVPYRMIAAYSVCTAGSLDYDTELYVYTKNSSNKLGEFKKEFKKDRVNLFAILNLLNYYVLQSLDPFAEGIRDDSIGQDLPKLIEPEEQAVSDILGDNAAELDPEATQQKLRHILLPTERVRIAYKSVRDLTVFTTKRVLIVDKKGITGKSVDYLSVLYSHIRMFSIETAAGGVFDRDAHIELYTNIDQLPAIKQDVKKSCNVLKTQRFLTDLVCGIHEGQKVTTSNTNAADLGGGDYMKSLPKWLSGEGNAGQIDASAANAMFHEEPNNILQDNEVVEMAFKGRKDYMLFTTKRILFVDNITIIFTGKKVKYLTIPYFAISHFAIQTPGRGLVFADRDAELQIWTDCCNFRHERGSGDDHHPPEPLDTFIEQDLAKKKVDLVAVHRYLSYRMLSLGPETTKFQQEELPRPNLPLIPVRPSVPDEDSALSVLHEMFSDNAHEINAADIDSKLHANFMLQADETVGLAFANGRDLFVLTSKRIFIMDTKGLSGEKVQYITVPYSSVRYFEICTASTSGFDRDCELDIYVKGFWSTNNKSPNTDSAITSCISQDFSKGKCDLIGIYNFLSDRCVTHFADQTAFAQDIPQFIPYTSVEEGVGTKLVSLFDRNNISMLSNDEVAELNKELRFNPPLLLDENLEQIELGFNNNKKKCLVLFTNRRLIYVRRSKSILGLAGEKMKYASVPWTIFQAFRFQAAGKWADSDSEMYLYIEVFNKGELKFDIKKGKVNQQVINRWLDRKVVYKM